MPELEMLRRLLPPDPEPPRDDAVDAARAALVARIVREERMAAGRSTAAGLRRPGRAGRAWPRGRWLVVPALALAAVAGVLVQGIGRGPGVDNAVAAVLKRAAATARAAVPTRPLEPGQYLYTRSEDAYTSTTVMKAGAFTVLIPHRRESWLGPDNKGWLISHSGTPRFMSPRHREQWIALGRPDLGEGDMNLALENSDGPTPPMASLSLPDDPDVLYAQLEREAEGNSNGTNVEMFTLVADNLRETFTTPAQRAALYEVAARIPGVELVGTVRDPAGRSGTAVAIDGDHNSERHMLIFDPATASLLAEEYVALEGNWLQVPAGTRTGWSTYLEAEVVDRLKERP
jgi:hypothetical protein